MGGLQYEVEYFRIRRRQRSPTQSESAVETRHPHVQQVRILCSLYICKNYKLLLLCYFKDDDFFLNCINNNHQFILNNTDVIIL